MHHNNVHFQKILAAAVQLITLFTGPMFAEKSSALFSCLRRHARARQKVILFRPQVDTRGKTRPKTHDGGSLHIAKFGGEIIRISKIQRILDLALEKKAQVVGIDEAQFFHKDLIKILITLYEYGITVYISALDTDYKGRNFATTSRIMLHPLVNVKKSRAICTPCASSDGVYSIRKKVKKNQHNKRIVIGSKDKYIPICHACKKRISKI